MTNIVQFPHVDGAAASSSTTLGLSRAELREVTWMNFYAAERRLGTRPDLAHARADAHARRFDQLLDNIGKVMSEVG